MTRRAPPGKLGASLFCHRESTHAASALAVFGMVPEHACRNCDGGFGDGAGQGEGRAWVYTNLMVACTLDLQCLHLPNNRNKRHNAMFTCTASVCGRAHEWARTLARVACDWLALVLEYVAHDSGNHVVVPVSFAKQMRNSAQCDLTVSSPA